MYRLNNTGYPSTNNAWYAGSTACNATYGAGRSYTGSTGYIPNLAPTYIPVLPEVSNFGANKCFLYRSQNGTDYKLLVWQAIENYDANSPLADPGYGGTYPNCTTDRTNTYTIFTPGHACY